jgi:hypothetical protein
MDIGFITQIESKGGRDTTEVVNAQRHCGFSVGRYVWLFPEIISSEIMRLSEDAGNVGR